MKLFTMIKLNFIISKIRKIVGIFTQDKVKATAHTHMANINGSVVEFLFNALAKVPDALENASKLDPQLTLNIVNAVKSTYDMWKAIYDSYKGKAVGDVAEEFALTFKPVWLEYLKEFERAHKVTEASIDEIFGDVDPTKEVEELKNYVKENL